MKPENALASGGVGILLGALALHSPAYAQSAVRGATAAGAAPVLEELVVTAQRREQNLQDVPITVSAVTGATARALGVASTTDLSLVAPSVTFGSGQAGAAIVIRGISGSNTGGDESPNAVYLDGVYTPSTPNLLFSLSNVERVEILAGPQGTLFGRNASGGAIQIVTKDPSATPHVDLGLGFASFDTKTGELYATTGLADGLTIDLSAYGQDQGRGWGRNAFDGKYVHKGSALSLRSKLMWKPSDATTVLLALGHSEIKPSETEEYQILPGFRFAGGGPLSNGLYNTNSNLGGANRARSNNAALTVTQDMGWARLISISSYDRSSFPQLFDQDAAPARLFDVHLSRSARTFTQEVRLQSPSSSAISWTIGAYHFWNTFRYDPLLVQGNANFQVDSRLHTTSNAVFGQVTVPLAWETSLTGGVRYTHDDVEFDGMRRQLASGLIDQNVHPSKTLHKTNFRAALDHKFTPGVLGYVSYTTGYKSGLYNLGGPTNPFVKPQEVATWEAGLKSEMFDHRVRLNISAYDNKFTNIQVKASSAGSVILQNAAKASIRGVDVNSQFAVTNNMSILGGIAYADGNYDDFKGAQFFDFSKATTSIGVASGNATVQTPKWVATAAVLYTVPTSTGDVSIAASYKYNGSFFWDAQELMKQKSYNMLNLSVGWSSPSKTYDAKIWAKNALDEKYCAYAAPTGFGPTCYPAAPATVGVSVGAHF